MEDERTVLDALAADFKKHKRLLGYMARCMCGGNVAASADLVQDTMEKMLRAARDGKADPTVPFTTRARRVMAHRQTATSRRAEVSRLRLLGPNESIDETASPEPHPERALEAEQDDVLMNEMHDKVFERLPKTGHTRAVFDTSRDGVFDTKEQAERLGIRKDQVENARETITAKIAEVLAEHGLEMPKRKKKSGEGA